MTNPPPPSPRGEVMLRRVFCCLPLLLVGVAVRADKPAKTKDESSRFFAAKAVPRFAIGLDEAALKQLRQDPRKLAHATVTVDGAEFKDVGIHLKGGAGSYRGVDDRPALTLNFDKYVDHQRFHGL